VYENLTQFMNCILMSHAEALYHLLGQAKLIVLSSYNVIKFTIVYGVYE
jgi:hypothetical protein